MHSFIVVEKLGKTLQHYLDKTFSFKTVCQVGIRIIDMLE